MKKRACRHYCESCNLSFETWDRYSSHVLWRGHTANALPHASNDIQLFSEEPAPGELVSDDNDFFYLNNEYTLELEDENFNVVSSDENDLSDSDNISETSGSPQAEQEASTQPDSYFPFPSEIFFLLYSYAHNITRPKVTYFTIYLTNIFNQVLFCKKWLPLLLAGLNSTVECCWNNIVQCC